MDRLKNMFSLRIIYIFIIIIDCAVPLIIWPWGRDYYYYPKIITIYAILALSLIILFFLIKGKKAEFKFNNTLILAAAFVIWVILSWLFSKYRSQAFWGMDLRWEGALAFTAYFSILYISYLCVSSKLNLSTILKFIFISSVVLSVIGIIQYFGIDIIPRDYARKDWTYMSFSTLGNPNFFGSYLSLIFPIAICVLLASPKKYFFSYYALNIILFSAVICTRTRSAWVGLAVSAAFILVMLIKTDRTKLKRLAVLIIGCVLSVILLNKVHNNLISSKFQSLVSDYKTVTGSVVTGSVQNPRAGSERLFIWNRTLNYIYDRPVFGSGPDTFNKVFYMTSDEANFYFGTPNIYVDKAHNDYLQILITCGYPALLLYISFIVMLIIKTIKRIKNKGDSLFNISLLSGVIGYVVQNFFNISVVSVAPVFWSVLGLLIAANEK
jgi:Lipid A core - O-antigen ligase and related enzymes